MKNLSVIIPCHNEENSIVKTFDDLVRLLSENNFHFEIIIVNDASNDRTAALVNALPEPARVFHNETQIGYGGSLKRGIAQATHDMIVIIDADGTYPVPAVLSLFERAIEGNFDMVVGDRTKNNAQIPIFRRFGKWLLGQLANYLCERKIPDLNSGLRLMRKQAVEKYFHILPNGFSFTTTITLAMLTDNYAVSYIPIDYYKRVGRSKIRPIEDTLNFVFLIIRTVMYFNPLKIFLPLSLVFFLTGIILLIIRIFVARVLISVTVFSLIASFIILSLGLLADLIDRKMKC